MEDLKILLEEQKSLISSSLSSLAKTAEDTILQKNKKVHMLSIENGKLDSKIIAEISRIKKTFLGIISTEEELDALRKYNKLLKTLLKKEIYIRNMKKNIHDIKKDIESRETISGKDMAAFKIIALELEEKERIIKKNMTLLGTMENEKENLAQEKKKIEMLNSNMLNDLEFLRKKNVDLENINLAQLNTIETLSKEIQGKNDRIIELKNQFIQLLDHYNDILQKVN
ncbi:MAG: hypothetical protein LBI70_00305 [Rickettsiales bacterium]|jgi:chromosome segregation ATPase|nr:hypothetical protein [Rickettsiales bacterium]